MKRTTSALKEMKNKKEPITMVTAYDYPTAKLVDQAGIDFILVGDSLGMVVLGYESTISVTVDDMVHHTKAVTRGARESFVITDLPFLSYHGSFDRTLQACARLMQEAGAQAVKLEGGKELAETIRRLTAAGVPVVGHLGLTPQSVNQLGGYKVQGKDIESAQKLIDDALALEEAGACSIVLECIPAPLAQKVTEQLRIPTIGIGAGVDCDGQVLVLHDMVSFGSELSPKFVKKYGDVGEQMVQSVRQYIDEVKRKQFPTKEHSFSMKEETIAQLYGEGWTQKS